MTLAFLEATFLRITIRSVSGISWCQNWAIQARSARENCMDRRKVPFVGKLCRLISLITTRSVSEGQTMVPGSRFGLRSTGRNPLMKFPRKRVDRLRNFTHSSFGLVMPSFGR